MSIRALALGLTAATVLSISAAFAGPATSSNPPQQVYIQDFAATQAGAATESGNSRSSKKVADNAAALADALIHQLNARGVSASRLSAQDAAPTTGWVISGAFSEKVPHGLFSGFSASSSSSPNTEVTLSIRDTAAVPGSAPVVLTVPASLGGQGSALSADPYEIAIKLVAHQVESKKSIDDLASRIATQILAQHT